MAGSTRAWRRTRAYVLGRDGYLCQLKLPGCTTHAPLVGGHMHHTLGRHTGLDPAYLVASCEHCNTSLGDPTKADPQPISRTQWARA